MSLVPVAAVMGLPSIVGTRSQYEVQAALDYVSDAIESYCERCFAAKLADTITVDPYYSHVKGMPAIAPMASYGSYPGYGTSFSAFGSPYIGTALLPDPPVTAVSAINAFMPLASGGGPGWVALQNYQWTEDGLVWDTSGMPGTEESDGGPLPSWPQMPRSLQITYDHGFILPGTPSNDESPPLPDGIVAAVIRGCANVLLNPANVAAIKVGDLTTTFTQISGPQSGPAGTIGRLGLDELILAKYRLVHL